MATLFIADLHLCVEEPAITAGFLRFLAGEARKADALYILGDLFEAWIGDDDPNPLHRKMAAAIKAVSDSGVPCYFIHGNRDFLLGKRFARESGMTLLPEEKVLELYGRRVLIMHGDFSRQGPQTLAAAAIPRPAVVCAQTHCRANAREQQRSQQQ